MKLYKLTDKNDETLNHTKWGSNITHEINKDIEFGDLCTCSWIHAYEDPYLGLLMNPADANYNPYHLWEAEGDIGITDGLKVGCRRLTTIKRLEEPELNILNYRRFCILCILEILDEKFYSEWANGWLSSKDKFEDSIVETKMILYRKITRIVNYRIKLEPLAESILCAFSKLNSYNYYSYSIKEAFRWIKYIKNTTEEEITELSNHTELKFKTKIRDFSIIELAHQAMNI